MCVAVRNMNAAEIFKKRFADAMAPRGSRADFARKTGMSRTGIDAYISGESTPSIASLDRIADALDTTPQALIAPSEEPPPNPVYSTVVKKIDKLPSHMLTALNIFLDSLISSAAQVGPQAAEAKPKDGPIRKA
jgi:transcriptional regulator with XRE-family HTH domain